MFTKDELQQSELLDELGRLRLEVEILRTRIKKLEQGERDRLRSKMIRGNKRDKV